MATKTVFKVSFKGVILPGFDKDQVIENVHEITRIPKQTISRKFFSGKTVVIRHADSHDYANRLQKTFSQAGIETYINEFTETIAENDLKDTASLPPKADDHLVDDAPPPQKQKSNTAIIIIGIAAIIFISIVTLIFINDDNQTQTVKNDTQQKRSSNTDIINSNPTDNINKPIKTTKDSHSTNQHNAILPTKDKKPLEVVDTKQDNALSVEESFTDFLNKDKVSGLIIITDKTVLNQLMLFSTLLNIDANIINIVKNNLKSSLTISNENPLYLIKSSNETEQQYSIILSTNKKLPASLVSTLKKELNLNNKQTETEQNKNSFCSKKTLINVLNAHN